MLHDEIKKYLDNLDQDLQALVSVISGEHSIAQKIKDILKENTDYKLTIEDGAEQMAFDFMAEYPNDAGWGTYYGPMAILPDSNQQDQMVEYPSIQGINDEMLKYWGKRAKEMQNSILTSRYADLVVDFSPKVIDNTAHIDLFHIVIDSNIAICERLLTDSINCKTKIKRALALAIQTNDQERITKVKKAMINLEQQVALDDKPGLWGFSFKWLILDDSARKIKLSETEKIRLINDLEDRLKRVEGNAWLTENTVPLLAEYYANEKDESNLMRVLGVLEKSLKADERLNSDALLQAHTYQQIHETYGKYASHFTDARKANRRLSQEIGQLDLDPSKSLKGISVTQEIPKKDIDNFLQLIFGDKYELETIITNIVIKFLPKKKVMEKSLNDVSSESPIQFLCTHQIFHDDGTPIAKLPPLKEDYDKHFQRYASQYIQLGSFFLTLAIDELKKRVSKQNIMKYFRNSMLFGDDESKEYLERAISAYWDGDYLVSSHLFIPLIESAIRELIKICGGTVLKLNDLGGYDRFTLNQLLEKQGGHIIENVFSGLSQNMAFYFRLVLTKKLGMNWRNDFAHGFGKKKFSSEMVSDRLFHIMLCLSRVKKQKESK